jgi:hypothetical protein
MTVPYFTVTGGDGVIDLLGIEETPLEWAEVHFTPKLPSGTVLHIDDKLYRPRRLTVIADEDGQFTAALLANDPALDLPKPLEYEVSFTNVKRDGVAFPIKAWSFVAPNAGVTSELHSLPRII